MASRYKRRPQLNSGDISVAILLALIPVVAALMRCAIDGKLLTDIYLPNSEWNDELFYYKLTEGVLHGGYPDGYFGFNESHGQYLSFAAWSPVLLLFWVIWGAIFGWTLLSPIICNIVLMSVALFVFGLLVRPSIRQVGGIAVLFWAFTPVTRYMLSVMPEAQCFMLLILIIAVSIHFDRTESLGDVIAAAIFIALLTWMRPYFLILFPLLWVMWSRRSDAKTAIIRTAAFVGGTAVIYLAINRFFSAPYLTDLFYTDWLKAYVEQGFVGGLKYTGWKLATSLASIREMIGQGVQGEGLAAGALYLAFYLCILYWIVMWIVSAIRRRQGMRGGAIPLYVQGTIALASIAFAVADLLMYRLSEGSKHTMAFIVITLLLMPVMHENIVRNVSAYIALACCAYLFVFKAQIPYDYDLPYRSEARVADLGTLQSQLSETMELDESDVPSYENTIVWVLWDQVNGETVATDFGAFYVVPEGFGINLCDGGYVDAQLESMQSRYYGTTPGGAIAGRCEALGYTKIAESETLVVYRKD